MRCPRRSRRLSDFRPFRVSARDRGPLLTYLQDALERCGCTLLRVSPPNEAPFRLTFEAPDGERMGILAYAFLANARATRNRPCDEHRFQLKYGSKDGQLHELWQDPFQLYTTLLFGINPERGVFVGADRWRRFTWNGSWPGCPALPNGFDSRRRGVRISGCRWHGRDWEQRKERLGAGNNGPYWLAKIAYNRDRDRRDDALLANLGWRVARFWETDVLKDPEGAANRGAVIVAP